MLLSKAGANVNSRTQWWGQVTSGSAQPGLTTWEERTERVVCFLAVVQTPLMLAAQAGNDKVVSQLIELGADIFQVDKVGPPTLDSLSL